MNVKHQQIIAKNVLVQQNALNVKVDGIQSTEYAKNVVTKAVRIHVMYQQEFVKHVKLDIS